MIRRCSQPAARAPGTAPRNRVYAGDIRIGISGWRYAGWRGRFYPKALPQSRELEFASRKFHTIEINGTHYSLQRPQYFSRWHDETPDDFVFAVKGSRFITHMLQLRNSDVALANFFAQGLLCLDRKLGPVLWQFSPRFVFRPEKLQPFLAALPRTRRAAAHMSRHHDERLAGRSWTRAESDGPLRHAIEIRHQSFCTPEFIALLREYKTALVVADTVAWPLLTDTTADFVYVRLHGSKQLYTSGYGPKAIAKWADWITAWASGRPPKDGPHIAPATGKSGPKDVYVYFDNDAKVRAPADAIALEKRLAMSRTRQRV
jgi:uncharacterized protein YecE (DUF72 family)